MILRAMDVQQRFTTFYDGNDVSTSWDTDACRAYVVFEAQERRIRWADIIDKGATVASTAKVQNECFEGISVS